MTITKNAYDTVLDPTTIRHPVKDNDKSQKLDNFLGDRSASSDWLLVRSDSNGYKCDSSWLDTVQGVPQG